MDGARGWKRRSSDQVLSPAPEGGPRGAPPRAKTSTMSMRSPQHGQADDDRSWRLDRRCRAVPADQPPPLERPSTACHARCWPCSRHWPAARSGGCDETPSVGRGAGSVLALVWFIFLPMAIPSSPSGFLSRRARSAGASSAKLAIVTSHSFFWSALLSPESTQLVWRPASSARRQTVRGGNLEQQSHFR
jgi:hypothetical protein